MRIGRPRATRVRPDRHRARFIVSLRACRRVAIIALPPDWEPQLCELKAAVDVLKQQHLTDVDIGALLDATVHDGIKTLPYAPFFNAKERQAQLDDERRARDGTPGIRIVFDTRPDGLHIIDVIPDAPAERAGVRPDDLVVAMNDQSVVGIDSSEVVKLAKGDAGVPLRLKVRRGPNHTTLTFAPGRAIVKPCPASAKRLAGDIRAAAPRFGHRRRAAVVPGSRSRPCAVCGPAGARSVRASPPRAADAARAACARESRSVERRGAAAARIRYGCGLAAHAGDQCTRRSPGEDRPRTGPTDAGAADM
ncbi:hypothetical protein ABIC50_000160 [Burkholderia sp. 567]